MKRAHAIRYLGSAVVAAVVLQAVGCSTGGDNDLVPVRGEVIYKGDVVAGASVTFHAVTGANSAFGRTNAKGVYSLSTAQGDKGVAPGEYQVTIRKVNFSGGTSLSEDDPNYGKKRVERGSATSALPVRYCKPGSSGLTTVVSKEASSIDFELEAK